MVIEYITPVVLSLAFLLLLSLVYRPVLYVSIPAVLAAGLYAYSSVFLIMGYPTRDVAELSEPFRYLGHWSQNPTFLLAVPQAATEPRLYALDGLSEESRTGLAQGREAAKRGDVVRGLYREGEFEKHIFDPIEQLGRK